MTPAKALDSIDIIRALEMDGMVPPLSREELTTVEARPLPPSLAGNRNSQTPTADFLGAAWYVGKRTEVYQVAKERFLKDPNDLGSMLVMFFYSSSFGRVDELRALNPRIMTVGASIKTPEFDKLRKMFNLQNWMADQYLNHSTLPPKSESDLEAYKAYLDHKDLSCLELFKRWKKMANWPHLLLKNATL